VPGQLLQPFRMPPTSTQSAVTQRYQDADTHHQRAAFLHSSSDIDECADTRVGSMDEVDEVLREIVQARGKGLEFDAVEVDCY
jgi:hypothetical protein